MRVGGRRTLQGERGGGGERRYRDHLSGGRDRASGSQRGGKWRAGGRETEEEAGEQFSEAEMLASCVRAGGEPARAPRGQAYSAARSHSVCCALHTGPSDLQGNGRGPAASLDEGSAPEGPEFGT